jgi:hypothetical protein
MTARPAKRSAASRRSLGEAIRSPPGRTFRQEGEYWTIIYEGALFRLRDSKGLRYLAHLLSHPGEHIRAGDLIAVAGGRTGDAEPNAERARVAVTKRIKASVTKIGVLHPALAVCLSTRIKTGYFCLYIGDSDKRHAWAVS